MVDSRADSDIGISSEADGNLWRIGRLFRDLEGRSQGILSVVPAKAGIHTHRE